MIYVYAHFGKRGNWLRWDVERKEDAELRIEQILTKGIREFSKAGVFTITPPHQIRKITMRYAK